MRLIYYRIIISFKPLSLSLFYRIMNDDLISDSNIHRMTQTNRKFSIHSKGEETVYHDIADIPVCHWIIFSVNECISFIKCLKSGVLLNVNKFPFLYFLLKYILVSILLIVVYINQWNLLFKESNNALNVRQYGYSVPYYKVILYNRKQ